MPIGPLTRMMSEAEIAKCKGMLRLLETTPISNRALFNDLVAATFGHCGINPRQISDDLGFSLSSVYRWIEGKSAPHHSIWPVVVKWIDSALAARADEIRSAMADA